MILGGALSASAVTITFDDLADLDILSNQYAGQGIVFSNGIVLESGASLNEFEFPPRSGQRVGSDDGGPLVGQFSFLVESVSVFTTYAERLELIGYDTLGVAIASASSAFTENFVSSGNPANELMSISHPGIAWFELRGAATGGSFTLDDLTFVAHHTGVPDQGSLLSMTFATVAGLVGLRRRLAP